LCETITSELKIVAVAEAIGKILNYFPLVIQRPKSLNWVDEHRRYPLHSANQQPDEPNNRRAVNANPRATVNAGFPQ
jgi:hypothetical protein